MVNVIIMKAKLLLLPKQRKFCIHLSFVYLLHEPIFSQFTQN